MERTKVSCTSLCDYFAEDPMICEVSFKNFLFCWAPWTNFLCFRRPTYFKHCWHLQIKSNYQKIHGLEKRGLRLKISIQSVKVVIYLIQNWIWNSQRLLCSNRSRTDGERPDDVVFHSLFPWIMKKFLSHLFYAMNEFANFLWKRYPNTFCQYTEGKIKCIHVSRNNENRTNKGRWIL